MRPRRARLGCIRTQMKKEQDELASMRPRRARLGCQHRALLNGLAVPCFNEAEARAPRMRRRALQEATDRRHASMRPRRARLGCLGAKYGAGTNMYMLQ